MSDVIDKKQIRVIDHFFNDKSALSKIDKQARDDLIVFIFELLKYKYERNLTNKMITILYRTCYLETITLEEVWEIYWNLQSILFSNSEAFIYEGTIRDLYYHIFKGISEALPSNYSYRSIESRNQDLIVIITSQVLSVGHAPTVRVFDYAYALQHDLNKQVVIINDSGMNYILNNNLNANVKFSYVEEFENLDIIKYKNEDLKFIQNPIKMPNIEAILGIVDDIYNLNPLIVYNIGGSNLTADYCKYFTTTASLPCSNDIPVAASKYLLLGRRVQPSDSLELRKFLSDQILIETEINYQYRVCSTQYSREMWKIPQEQFLLVIVGNRLDIEITNNFLAILDKILKNLPWCGLALVGNIQNTDRILSGIEDTERLHLLGNLTDAGEFIKCCDIYLNPKRKGGGRSSFEAMNYEVPIITMPYGDVFNTCGEAFIVKTEEEIVNLIDKYYVDDIFRKKQKKLAKERATILSDIKGTLVEVIHKIIDHEEQFNG
ncbi:MAG: multimeric flavodoxin protein [Anaerocolumna sp.]|nr:multimeric flavodoxin protein [Anaerocolumna sp.]